MSIENELAEELRDALRAKDSRRRVVEGFDQVVETGTLASAEPSTILPHAGCPSQSGPRSRHSGRRTL